MLRTLSIRIPSADSALVARVVSVLTDLATEPVTVSSALLSNATAAVRVVSAEIREFVSTRTAAVIEPAPEPSIVSKRARSAAIAVARVDASEPSAATRRSCSVEAAVVRESASAAIAAVIEPAPEPSTVSKRPLSALSAFRRVVASPETAVVRSVISVARAAAVVSR